MTTSKVAAFSPHAKTPEDVFATLSQQACTYASTLDTVVKKLKLGDAPSVLQVIKLFDHARSVAFLKGGEWKTSPPEFSTSVSDTCVAAILLRIASAKKTGVVVFESLYGYKTVATRGGRLIASSSDQENEQLGAYLQRCGILSRDDALKVRKIMTEKDQTLGFALLQAGLVDVQTLLSAQTRQGRERVVELFDWTSGTAAFYEAPQVEHLADMLDMSVHATFRQAFATLDSLSPDRMRLLVEPLFESAHGLERSEPIEGIATELTPAERHVLEGGNATASQLIDTASADLKAACLKALYVYVQLGLLRLQGGHNVVLQTVPKTTAQATPEQDSQSSAGSERNPLDELQEYKAQQQLLALGKRLLSTYQPESATEKLEELAKRQKSPKVEVMAYLAIAHALSGNTARASEMANKALQLDKGDALAHAAMARCFEASREAAKAELHRRKALSLSQNNGAYLREVEAALALSASRNAAENKQSSHQVGLAPYFVLLGVFVVLFVMSNVLRLGANEYFYSGTDWFFYFRRSWLIVAGLFGIGVLGAAYGPRALLANLSWKSQDSAARAIGLLTLALLYGALAGVVSPVQRVTGSVAVVVGLTLFHVLSEEIFFRSFVMQTLSKTLGNERLTLTLGAVIFGLYHLTFYSFWIESGLIPRLSWVGLIVVGAGIPYGFFYQRTNNLIYPLICHATVNLVMMTKAFLH